MKSRVLHSLSVFFFCLFSSMFSVLLFLQKTNNGGKILIWSLVYKFGGFGVKPLESAFENMHTQSAELQYVQLNHTCLHVLKNILMIRVWKLLCSAVCVCQSEASSDRLVTGRSGRCCSPPEHSGWSNYAHPLPIRELHHTFKWTRPLNH